MVFLLCAGALAVSQEELDAKSASGLLGEATRSLSTENFGGAIPYLEAYLDRMKDVDEDRVKILMQEVRLKLGKIFAWLQDPIGAAEYLKLYTEQLPQYKPREVYKLLAHNLYEAGSYEEAIAAATTALSRPLPKELPKREKKVDYEELSKDDMGGFTARQLERYEEQAREARDNEKDLSEGFSESTPDPEPDYTIKELVLLNMTLAESHMALEQWEATLAPYQYVIENTADESRKGYAILQTVNALIELERFREAQDFVVKLYRTDARYDIRVNMALMKTAAALSNAGELESALMIYRMVLPREVLIEYQQKKMNKIRRIEGLPEVEVKVVENELGRPIAQFIENTSGLFGGDEFSEPGAAPVLPPKPLELVKLEDLVVALVSLPPYENNVLYRTGALYAQLQLPWEAVAALSTVFERDPGGDLGQRAFAESLQVLVDPLSEYERVERLATAFLATHREGLGPRMVAHALTGCYQKQELWKKIKSLLPVIQGFLPSKVAVILQYECELYYMQAIADLMLFNYSEALAGFEKVLVEFPNSHQQENASYWHAMSQLFLKNYEAALEEFDAYVVQYPEGNWLPEATFQIGVCNFSLDRLDIAQAQFTAVIDRYTDSAVYPDARSMRGDLLASKGGDLLDLAQKDYEAAIAAPQATIKQDTYAVFQMVAMFELEQRYDEMIDVVEAYMDRRGEEADVAKAAYWIGKTKLSQGRVDEAVEAYRETIVQYGGNVLQDGVDLIIGELVKVAGWLDEEPRRVLEDNLRADADAADSETLRLRIQVLLAKINGTELELGKKLTLEHSDLTQAPPPVLSLICKASFAAGNYSRAEEILTIFQNRFDDSEFMQEAYKLRVYDLFGKGELDAAMTLVLEAQGLYGTQPHAAWAQLMKGRIEYRRGELDAALKTFQNVFNVREWRGEPCAEAAYRLGEVEEAADRPRQAFAWYQRAYMQYKGYAQGKWAAEAYLASARCLEKLGLETDRRNTYRAMLFDRYVNHLPQADEAKTALGEAEVLEIKTLIEQGIHSNVVVTVDSEGAE